MKFEKFLKSVGTHGVVIERSESEKWLVCGGVGMVIPKGVENLLGRSVSAEAVPAINVISTATYDDPLTLNRAVLFDADGKANDIYRVFTTDYDETIGIVNAEYGLIERKDILSYAEIEFDTDENGVPKNGEVKTVKYMLVFDRAGDIQGFITGSTHF